jgi:hypothetical protein
MNRSEDMGTNRDASWGPDVIGRVCGILLLFETSYLNSFGFGIKDANMTHLKWLLSFLLALLLCGCRVGEGVESTPTVSAEQVIQTARVMADQTREASSPTVTRPLATTTPAQSTWTPTPVPSATGSSPVLRVDYNANIRSGPGENYEIIDVIFQGDIVDVIGRYDETPIGTWFSIVRRGPGLDGWVWSGAVSLEGDINQIPILLPPPTSTPSPGPTSPPEPIQTLTPTETAAP